MSEKNTNVPKIRFPGFMDDWEQRRFKDNIVSIQTGTNLLGSETNSGVPLLKMGNIQRGYFSFNKLEHLDNQQDVEEENFARYGDFLFNTRNTLELVGKGATWTGSSDQFAFNSNIARFIFDGIDTIFFNYLYNTQQIISQIRARAVGSTSVAAVYPRDLNSVEYFLPNIEEQKRIGSFFLQFDNLITLHQRKLNNLQDKKKSLLQKMFPKNGANVPEIRFPGFTHAWEQRKLGEVYDIVSGYAFKRSDYAQNGVPIINGESIQQGSISTKNLNFLPEEFLDRYRSIVLDTGDIVLGLNRPITNGNLKIAQIPKDLQGSLLYQRAGKIITFNNTNINFSYQMLGKEVANFVLKEAVGSDQPFISTTKLKKWLISIPTSEEQTKIGGFFKDLDNLITLHQRKLNHLQEQKKSLLQQMFV